MVTQLMILEHKLPPQLHAFGASKSVPNSLLPAGHVRQKRCRRRAFQQGFQAVQSSVSTAPVSVVVNKAGTNARCLFASVDISAPVAIVWGALTDYDGLADFIPGLSENRCLRRSPRGATLLQVGEQDIAFGAKFKARVVLNITEHRNGLPPDMCIGQASNGSKAAGTLHVQAKSNVFPLPPSTLSSPAQDIAFKLVEGDFQVFKGVWRMQETSGCTRLSYSLLVRPQQWLPVRLVQGRIEGEIKANLAAVRWHTERLFKRQIT